MTTRRVRWGVLGVARIATAHVLPAMRSARHAQVVAVASRDGARAREAAARFDIARAHASYDALLADPDVEAVYIPLPNDLHVPWAMRALDAGKHVLCEKPLALDAAGAERLAEAARRHPALTVMEAFMYRFHAQWLRTKALVDGGAIGALRAVHTWFSYYTVQPDNVRNRPIGGGGLLDIGCYGISVARWLFGAEPRRVSGATEIDPAFGVDRLASALLEFDAGVGTFTCGTQLAPFQRVDVVGTAGRIEVPLPFNATDGGPVLLHVTTEGRTETVALPACNQYAEQADAFSLAVLNGTPAPTPLDDAVANMRVIDQVRLGTTGRE